MKVFDSHCTRCVLHNSAKSVCIPSSGPDDAAIMLFGEAPGADEDDANAPFVGAAGRELDSLLSVAGLSRDTVRVSNTVRCRPPSNRTPHDAERQACMYYTVRELAYVKPKVIIALGASALKALTGESVIGRNRGKLLSLLPQYRADVPVLATYHPAAYLHNAGMRDAYSKAIVEDMELAQKVASGKKLRMRRVTGLDLGQRIQRTLRDLSKCDVLGCDLEWEVLPGKKKDPQGMWPWSRRQGRKPRPISIAIAGRVGDRLVALSLPFDHPQIEKLRALVAKKPTIFHNAMADLIWLYALKWDVKLEGCSYVLASLLNIDSSLSLKALAPRLTDMEAGWEEEANAGTMPATTAEWRKMMKYNGQDAIGTLILHERLLEIMHEEDRSDAFPLYSTILVPAIEILSRTALRGVPIDERLLLDMQKKLLRKKIRLTEKIGDTLQFSGSYETILARGEKLAPYLMRLGLDLPRTRKTDKPSVTNDVLLQHKDSHPIVPDIIQVRKLSKRESSYYRPWAWLLEQQRDRRLHTIYRLAVARTGRSSAESEAGYTFQQFPRDAAVRDIVRAKKGWRILSVDQSQIELRLIAWRAHERRMHLFFRNQYKYRDASPQFKARAAYKKWDLHYAMAGFMKALQHGWTTQKYVGDAYKNMEQWVDGVTKDERFGAKPVNFGLSYGGGASVIQKTARQDYGITYTDEQAELGFDAYHLFYPDIRPWQESFWSDVERGYGVTSLGRRRVVDDDGEGPEGVWRKYINLDIQATASDLALLCMDYTWELLEKAVGRDIDDYVENIGFFHDAMLLHFDEALEEEVASIVKQAWEQPPLERVGLQLTVPLEAEVSIGRRWKS